jgi:hypothetical protein
MPEIFKRAVVSFEYDELDGAVIQFVDGNCHEY